MYMKGKEFKTQPQNNKYLLAIYTGNRAKFNKQHLRSTLFSLLKEHFLNASSDSKHRLSSDRETDYAHSYIEK